LYRSVTLLSLLLRRAAEMPVIHTCAVVIAKVIRMDSQSQIVSSSTGYPMNIPVYTI